MDIENSQISMNMARYGRSDGGQVLHEQASDEPVISGCHGGYL